MQILSRAKPACPRASTRGRPGSCRSYADAPPGSPGGPERWPVPGRSPARGPLSAPASRAGPRGQGTHSALSAHAWSTPARRHAQNPQPGLGSLGVVCGWPPAGQRRVRGHASCWVARTSGEGHPPRQGSLPRRGQGG